MIVCHKGPECKGSKKKQQNAAKTKIQLDGRGSQKGEERELFILAFFSFLFL